MVQEQDEHYTHLYQEFNHTVDLYAWCNEFHYNYLKYEKSRYTFTQISFIWLSCNNNSCVIIIIITCISWWYYYGFNR
ncbi:hypothetical protein IFM46972_11575 [Aspergillus udagawae]|uniref:Uncharacterized protein n=1 Tax=Aspergillus udagawae TaxID=91492 RepID=A0A8H3SHC3_9EURO|nr:hypothetical protein IFM46972_11575 [Aspergillus udagawae]